MKIHEILNGAINILMLVFLIFPASLQEVLKMDPYRLVVLFIFIASSIYSIYLFIMFLRRRHKPLKVLSTLEKPPVVIRNPSGYIYLVEGNDCYHIPDLDTFNYLAAYYGAFWNNMKTMDQDDIEKTFQMGRQLPSIRVYFPKP